MKKIIASILGFTFLGLGLSAEMKIITVDLSKLYSEYYKTKEASEKIQNSIEKAKVQQEDLVAVGQTLVEDFKDIMEMVENPALTEEARSKAQSDAESKRQEILEKEREVQQFQANTQRSLQQRQRTYHDLFIDEIMGVVLEVGRERGGDLILDSSGVTAVGVPAVIFADPTWDVTDIVLERINADAPE